MIGTITTIAFVLGKNSGNILPQLAVFSLGFLRILPAIQQIYSNIANIKTYSPALDAINSCLNETSLYSEIKSSKTLHKLEDYEVNKENFGFPSMPIITLSNVSFKYPLSSEITFTKAPASTKMLAICRPINPVPPVIKQFFLLKKFRTLSFNIFLSH